MGIAVSLIIIAVGAILAFAVNPSGNPAVDPNTAGWVLMIVGIAGLIIDILLWESWGPGYMRRRRVAYDGRPAAPPPAAPARRTTIVEDEVVDSPPGPPPPP
ncbi:MAG TPA: hypothetical protein VGJ77_19970 [Gaiellaceae bacterium]|jgi:hypothetical protein